MTNRPARNALVRDRSPHVLAHHRTRAAGTAIASLNAEGLVPSSSALDILAAWRGGGLSTSDALAAVKEAHDVK